MWVDPPMCARSREVIHGLLRRTTHQLEKEIQLCKQREKKVMAYVVVFLSSFDFGTSSLVLENANVAKGCKHSMSSSKLGYGWL
ncbi:hypothetical protein RHMOL_Rhmol12G0120400 [Rhododendron molle]|nr:hypothetical protein RHMOL_Rhmol12G0120400 [Rhododendron molle]